MAKHITPKKTKRQTNKTLQWLVIKEYLLIGMVLFSFGLLSVEMTGALTTRQLQLIGEYEVVLSFIFMADFGYELWLSSDKRRYFFHNWFFLLAALPFPSNIADILRSVRFLRIIRLARATAHLDFARHNHII